MYFTKSICFGMGLLNCLRGKGVGGKLRITNWEYSEICVSILVQP